jgi:hypothetical protein
MGGAKNSRNSPAEGNKLPLNRRANHRTKQNYVIENPKTTFKNKKVFQQPTTEIC